MSDHPEIAETIRRTYRHLVVDEYQDVSPLQEALLNLWRGERAELCVVGDPAQTIHSFAGARASFLTGFGQRFPDATVIRLVRDYRSTPQVVRCANSIMAAAASESTRRGFQPVTLQAQQPSGPEVEFVESQDESVEAAGIGRLARRSSQVGRGLPGAKWPYSSASTHSRLPLSRRWPTATFPTWYAVANVSTSARRCAQTLVALRAAARTGTGAEQGSAAEQMKAILLALGWTAAPRRWRGTA